MKKGIKFLAIVLTLSFFASTAYAQNILTTTATVTTRTIGYSYNGKMITMNVGDEFVLNLGDKYSWSPMTDNADVLDKVQSITGIYGSQGVFKAMAPGKATLKAIGKTTNPVRIFYFNLKIKVAGETGGTSEDTNVSKSITHTITSSNNASIIKIKKGDVLRVKLSDNYKWDIKAAGSSLSYMDVPASDKEYQAYYKADRVGTTIITGTGKPACFESTSYCELTTGNFRVRVRVVDEE